MEGCLIELLLGFLDLWLFASVAGGDSVVGGIQERRLRVGSAASLLFALGLAAVLAMRAFAPQAGAPYALLIGICITGIVAGIAWEIVDWWRE